jgi:hypothetical protein
VFPLCAFVTSHGVRSAFPQARNGPFPALFAQKGTPVTVPHRLSRGSGHHAGALPWEIRLAKMR